jgi:hypothetical protein
MVGGPPYGVAELGDLLARTQTKKGNCLCNALASLTSNQSRGIPRGIIPSDCRLPCEARLGILTVGLRS